MRPLSSTKTALRGRLKKHTDIAKRKSSGIKGLDELIEGGFPNHFAVLLLGPRGCGKGVFGNQILWEGLKKGERGIILAYDHSPDDIRRSMASFGWDVAPYEDENKFAIIDCFNGVVGIDSHEKYYVRNPLDINQLIYTLEKCVAEVVSNDDQLRVFLQSAIAFFNTPNVSSLFKLSRRFHLYVKKYNAVALVSVHQGSQNKVADILARQIIDGIIEFDKRTENDRTNYYLRISKMALTNRSKVFHSYVINNNGIAVFGSKTSE